MRRATSHSEPGSRRSHARSGSCASRAGRPGAARGPAGCRPPPPAGASPGPLDPAAPSPARTIGRRARLPVSDAPERAADSSSRRGRRRRSPPARRPGLVQASVPGRTRYELRRRCRLLGDTGGFPATGGNRPRLPRERAAATGEAVRRPPGAGRLERRGHRGRSIPFHRAPTSCGASSSARW